jgi:hypothetical protein
MRKIREILRLRSSGLSPRRIATSVGAALSTIQECLRRAIQAGLSWPLPDEFDDERIESLLYPQKPREDAVPLPDFARVQRELARPGVTRMLLWQEYKAEHPDGLQYTAFCIHYRKWLERIAEPVMRFEHRAGDKCFVDYAGQTAEGSIARAARSARRRSLSPCWAAQTTPTPKRVGRKRSPIGSAPTCERWSSSAVRRRRSSQTT